MSARRYTLGSRQKHGPAKLKIIVLLVVLAVASGGLYYVSQRTTSLQAIRQLAVATFGSNNSKTEKQLSNNFVEAVEASNVKDSQLPIVQMTSPQNGQILSGDVVVTADAKDNIAVAKVEFYIDANLVGSDETQPFSYSWASSGEQNGRHVLVVKAYDAAGNVAQSQAIVTTQNKPKDATPPIVTLTGPSDGSLIKGLTTLKATAYDNSGIAKVEFYAGTTLIGSDQTRPYSFDWDASKFSGVKKLTARAYDNTGNINTSAISTVLVDGSPSDTSKPDISLTSSGDDNVVNGVVVLNAEALDNKGVVKVEFYRGDVLLSTDIQAPFMFAWNSASIENGSYQMMAKAYDAAGNFQVSKPLNMTANNQPSQKPAPSFLVPNYDSPNLQSKVTAYGDCVGDFAGKPSSVPASMNDKAVIAGYEFTTKCRPGGKSVNINLDLGREVQNKSLLKVYKAKVDGSTVDITTATMIATHKSVDGNHTFVTYSIVDGGENDQDSVVNGVIVDPVFVVQELPPKTVVATQPSPTTVAGNTANDSEVTEGQSARLIDAIGASNYVHYGVGVAVVGVLAAVIWPRRRYRLRR